MKKTIIIFDKHNINYWAEGGTLLGCIREGKIIDTDVRLLYNPYNTAGIGGLAITVMF